MCGFCSVVCAAHATLRQQSAGDNESTESNIARQSIDFTREGEAAPKKMNENNRLTNQLKKWFNGVTFKKSNSILCYFSCSSEEQIFLLRCQYKSGGLQTLLESVFTLLVGTSEKVLIDELTWNLDDYNENLARLSQLKALGMCLPDRIYLSYLSNLSNSIIHC